MKLFYRPLLFTCLLFIFLSLDYCSPRKDDSSSIQPATSEAQIKKFHKRLITDKSYALGAVMTDSATNETILAYGDKNADGSLKTIRQIVDYIPGSSLAVINYSTSSYLPTSLVINTSNISVTIKYNSVDLVTGNILCDVTDNHDGKTLVSNKLVVLTNQQTEALRNGKDILQNNFKSGGRVGFLCGTINVILKFVQAQACVESVIATTVLALNPITAVFAEAAGILTVITCKPVIEKILQNEPEEIPCGEITPEDIKEAQDECVKELLAKGFGSPGPPDECYKSAFLLILKWAQNPTKNPLTGDGWGDPHLTTTDNFYYDFQGYGEFTAIKSTEDNFEVQVRQEDLWNSKAATVNTAIGIHTGTDIVSITAKPFNIYVNNKQQIVSTNGFPLAGNASISKATINNVDVYTIKTVNNDAIKVSLVRSDYLDYSLFLNPNRKGKVTGLLGNFDGDRTNDLQTRSGKFIVYSFDNLYPDYTDSWRIDNQPNYPTLLHYDIGKDTKSYTVYGFPASPTALAAQKLKDAETTCRNAGVNSEPYLSNCIYDVAITNDLSLIKSALWSQQNNASTRIPYESGINEIKNIRITVSNDPAIKNDSCLLSLSAGKVFQVKDGAQHASEVDILFLYGGYNDELYAHKPAFAADLTRQGPLLHRELLSQKWSVYKNTALESQAFVRDDNPSAENRVDAALWDYIKTTIDLRNSFYSAPSLLQNRDRFDETAIISGDATASSILMNKTIRRFMTQDGKLGIIRFNKWGKKAEGWWLTMDIKVQK